MDCLWELFKYRFGEKNVADVKLCLILCWQQFTLTKETQEWSERPTEQKGKNEESKYNAFLETLSDKINVDWLKSVCREKSNKTKTESQLELKKNVKCFLDGGDKITSKLVNKKRNFLLQSEEICINVLLMQLKLPSQPSTLRQN